MPYSVYFKFNGKKYKLPTNPEQISIKRDMNIESFLVLGGTKVSVPSGVELYNINFSFELPGRPYHYVETLNDFKPAYYYEKMFKKAQLNAKPLRFIASNGIKDISLRVLIKNIEILEKAGEEGDKYITLSLVEYRPATKRYKAVETNKGVVKKEEVKVEETKIEKDNKQEKTERTHTVKRGDTLYGLAKKYYGNGSLYKKIFKANKSIKNPNLIYDGQVIVIP